MNKTRMIATLSLLLLGGCGQFGPTHAAVLGASLVGAGVWAAAKVGADSASEKLYAATHDGDMSICKTGMYNIYCKKTREIIARQMALGKQNASYDEMTAAVARCDAGKIPEPPYDEKKCDKYRAFVAEIDARVAELKKSGVV